MREKQFHLLFKNQKEELACDEKFLDEATTKKHNLMHGIHHE